MKAITIRELHTRTGKWVRRAAEHGEIVITDRGHPVARIVPESGEAETPYFAKRTFSPRFRKFAATGKLGKGTDSTIAISEDREERDV